MSVAPASTAFLSSVFRSMAGPRSHRQVRVESLGGLRSFQAVRPAGVAGGAGQPFDEAQRQSDDAARPFPVAPRRPQLRLDRAPCQREAGDTERQAREPLERDLRSPGRGEVRVERARKRRRIAVEVVRKDGLGSEPRRHEGLVHPVSRQRVDKPRRVADEQGALCRGPGSRPTHRETKAADAFEPFLRDAVLTADAREVCSQARAPPLPTPHPPPPQHHHPPQPPPQTPTKPLTPPPKPTPTTTPPSSPLNPPSLLY